MTNDNRQPSAVDELSERFWEAILQLNPVTATVYGDERYADRLDDPGPEGRAAARRLMERTLAEVDAIPVDGLPTEDRITRDMLRVVAELGIEEDDQRIYQLRVVDQMSGPQQTLPQLTSFQTADTPAPSSRKRVLVTFRRVPGGNGVRVIANDATRPTLTTTRQFSLVRPFVPRFAILLSNNQDTVDFAFQTG